MKYHVLTFGCQMNTSDSERINTLLQQCGFESCDEMSEADLVVMNTCSVKQKAEDKVWGHVGKVERMKKEKPNLRVGLTGCMVRQSGVAHSYEPGVEKKRDHLFQNSTILDFVFRIEDLGQVPKMLSQIYTQDIGKDFSDELESYFQIRPEYKTAFQVFVPVQTGCNKFCTYCIVPFTRGREFSRPMDEIVSEVEVLVAQGAKDVTLLGQTVNSYRYPDSSRNFSDNNFVELLYRLDKIPGLDRLRYTSPHPMDMKDELIQAHVDLKTMCNHVHLPVQSGSNEILKKMNRKYTREQYLEMIQKVKETIPEVAITTDIIVGFPGETEEDFQATYDLFQDVRFDMSFTSRYSVRSGTYAAKKIPDDISPAEKARRWHELNELLKMIAVENNQSYYSHIYPVLVERRLSDGRYEGMTRSMKRVQFPSSKIGLEGTVVPIKIKSAQAWVLLGEELGT